MEDKSTSDDMPRLLPAYGYPDDDGDVSRRPEFVLLEEYAYFADRDNATTASYELRGPGLGGSNKVTFCTVRPPRVSYWCVHATAFPHTAFAMEPDVLATDRGLVLLRVVLGHPPDMFRPRLFHYFLYTTPAPRHAAARRSSTSRHDANNRHGASGFTLRPHGASQEDHDCGDCNYVIAAKRCGFGMETPHELCLYHSETEAWSTKPVTALEDASLHHHYTNKAVLIAMGGEAGAVTRVDLDRQILLRDVLAETSTLRRISLPLPVMPLGSSYPRSVDGFIEFTELHITGGDRKMKIEPVLA